MMRVTARTRSIAAALPVVVLAALLAVMLAGCGQKGPLMLPGDQETRSGAPDGGTTTGSQSSDEDDEESTTGAQRQPR